ncbi:hypothetical protein ABZZ79_30140 [Streptomyces sp. NPDC006458]|uniref:hypothetical protein n=1 Tax=Streptomyces sp. NPDC006458 TaxID=3154302 RepID=UPI0033BD5F85
MSKEAKRRGTPSARSFLPPEDVMTTTAEQTSRSAPYRNGDVMQHLNPPTAHTALPPRDAENSRNDGPMCAASDAASETHPVSATLTLLPLVVEPETPRFRWETKLVANEASGPNARLRVRPRLTVARWSGDVDAASQISEKLVDNAARHGMPLSGGFVGLRLTVLPETDELRVEVDDAEPLFPGFNAITCGSPQRGSGLWWVHHYGGQLSWDVRVDDAGQVVGKTVTVVLRPADESEPV